MRYCLIYFFALVFSACNNAGNIDTEIEEVQQVNVAPPPGYKHVTKSSGMSEVLCQCWENPDDMDAAGKFSNEVESFLVIRGYCFFNDSTLLKHPRGYAEPGTWTLEKKQNSLFINIKTTSGKQQLRVAQLTPSWLSIKVEEEIDKYFAPSLVMTDNSKNPFHPDNNRWRVKPLRSESDAQIMNRLKGSIRFYILLYEHFINSETSAVDFTGYPSVFNWYAGGIFLKKKNEQQEKWIGCFYNEADANKAYKFAEELMDTKYVWPKGERNWMKQNVSVLKQMENKLP